MQSSSSGRGHVLVLGPPRSGTTLLASIIGYHPDVRMMSECESHEHRRQIGGRVVGNKLCVPNHITLETEGPLLERPVSPKSNLARLADVLRRLTGHERPPPKSIRFYVEEWGAKLVVIVRDPDHVVHSIQRRGGQTAEIARYRWAEAVTTIHRLLDVYPEKTHLIQFKDLVAQPEAAARGVCTFLGLDFDSRMLEGYRGTHQYDRDKIDPSVARKPVPDAEMARYYPEAVEHYRAMIGGDEPEQLDAPLAGAMS